MRQGNASLNQESASSAKMGPLFKLALRSGVVLAIRLHLRNPDMINCRDSSGMTPLLVAAAAGHVEACRVLLEAGADASLRDHDGRGLADVMPPQKMEQILSLLQPERVNPLESAHVIASGPITKPDDISENAPPVDFPANNTPGDSLSLEQSLPDEGRLSDSFSTFSEENDTEENLLTSAVDEPEDEGDAGFEPLLDSWIPEGSPDVVELEAITSSPLIDPAEASDEMEERVVPRSSDLHESEESLFLAPSNLQATGRVPQSSLGGVTSHEERELDAWQAEEWLEQAEDDSSLGGWDPEEESNLERADDTEREFARRLMADLATQVVVNLGQDWDQELDLPILIGGAYSLDAALRSDLAEVARYLMASIQRGAYALEDLQEYAFLANAFAPAFMADLRDYLHAAGARLDAPVSDLGEFEESEDGDLDEVIADLAQLEGVIGTPPSALNRVLARLKPYEIYSRARERELGNEIARGEPGWEKARNLLALSQSWLIAKTARAYQGQGVDFEDLCQIGFEGALKAAEKWNPDRGFRFSTYSQWWIRQALHRAVADLGRVIRVPVHMHETRRKVRALEMELSRRWGLEIDDLGDRGLLEVAKQLDMTPEKLRQVKELTGDVESLDAGGELELVEAEIRFSTQTSDPGMEETAEKASIQEAVQRLMQSLSEKERHVLNSRFGLLSGEPMTLEEIGMEFGVTRERIRQIEAKAVRKLSNKKTMRELAGAFAIGEPPASIRGAPRNAAAVEPAQRGRPAKNKVSVAPSKERG